jgi:Family of unknown function (DUF6401)
MDIADERVPPGSVVEAARLALAQWIRRVGRPGFAAMAGNPALVARVDQHAAAVRDALTGRHGVITATDLASYADGVCDTATKRGWRLAREYGDECWAEGPWPLLRLLAVCLIARERGLGAA